VVDALRSEWVAHPLERQALVSLCAQQVISPADVERADRLRREQGSPGPLSGLLVSLGLVTERAMAEALASAFQLRLVDSSEFPVEPVAMDRVSHSFLAEHRCLILAEGDDGVEVACADPSDEFALEALRLALERPVNLAVALPSQLEAALAEVQTAEQGRATGEVADLVYEADAERLRELASEAPVVKLVGQLLQRAAEARASDIHIEVFEDRLRFCLRVDGILREIDSRPVSLASAVISRVKIMADLDIAERRLPQDGRFNVRAAGRNIDLRVSTVPTLFGESVVIRLLNREDVALEFEAQGFGAGIRDSLAQVLAQPHGIFLVTGPTGSGKSTTLYAALRVLNTGERKILTVEDPVEYYLDGINQMQVKSQIGLTFAGALRSIVRQDPDVIMVGEMRDHETADIAVHAALTGHLVLSTLHTNDAASSLGRLLDMGVEDYLLTSTVIAILAQRLVRRLCPHCREAYKPSTVLSERWRLAERSGGEEPRLYRAVGCPQCGGTGYQGRTAIGELLQMSDAVRDLVLSRTDAGRIAAQARKEGMISLFDDGLGKALSGVTSVEEVLRVTREV